MAGKRLGSLVCCCFDMSLPILSRASYCFLTCLLAVANLRAAEKLQFNRDIRPLLSDRCFKCHGPDEKARKAKLWDEEPKPSYSKAQVASQLLSFTAYAQSKGWSAEELLRSETENVRKKLLKVEASRIS